ncbi:hypothetical protein [Dyella nitratireducens]|uniref:Uncharacterized protein n=1 Tax=Dyella nitratireducens TaxID=1849580 RepID=A0ABQ1GKB5_9GAMM|nr:hypothetical protein [Dyella nitratireducens]GGA44932.1 hypothetical protein GCM10010981_37500 [Dyella nitratireducens]GLQ41252.1 hypothetical protein GCM10007902_11020 [Dyella nitratireducens]
MSNVIQFLEKVGNAAQWDDVTEGKLELALAEADIEGPFRSAILNKDVAQLQVLLQQKEPVCFVIPGEEEEEEEGEEEPGEKGQLKDARCLPRVRFASRS